MDGRFFTPGAIAPVPSWERDAAARVSTAETAGVLGSLHDPPLEPRDEAVFLLTAAAEIEHALMVQYLFAAYSVRVVDGDPNEAELGRVRDLLTQIAREEMGHLATVQNLLHLVGGPLNLNREHSPYASTIYPFRFTLEPVTLDSLAKYVVAESPEVLPATMPDPDKALLEQIRVDAVVANGGQEVRHVGLLFERLAQLFASEMSDADLRLDTAARHADVADWGFEPRNAAAGESLIVDSFPEVDVGLLRESATAAVRRIGAQGEGHDVGPVGSESHFERFFDIYQKVSALTSAGAAVTWPVATNPNTTPLADPAGRPDGPGGMEAALEADAAAGRITDPRARAWAQLFNLRYRLLLGQLAHFLRLDNELYSAEPGPRRGDRTDRGLLLIGTFDEMRRLKKIAGKLVQLPKDGPAGAVHAGPPFELPYTLTLPDGEPQRWRTHLDASRAAARLIERLQLTDPTDSFLDDLVERDATARTIMLSLAQGHGIPAGSLPTGFAKVVGILEEAVRGFRIGRHGNAWAGTTHDQFLVADFAGLQPIGRGPDGSVDPDPDAAPLVQRLSDPRPRSRMPRFRPAVPADRIAFIRQWIADGGPDDTPAGEVGVEHERDPAPEPVAPSGPSTLGFEADIRALFRATPDRSSMLFRFDLHRFEDVRDNATDILARLDDGSMPCDLPWPPQRVAVFRQWITDGRQP